MLTAEDASLPVQTSVEQTGSSSPTITLAHHFGICFPQFFGQTKPIVQLFFFSLKANQKGWSKFTFHLFACLKHVPRKKALFRQLRQRTEIHHNLQ